MGKEWNMICVELSISLVMLSQTQLMASSGEVIKKVADRLEAEQIVGGVSEGTWPEEADFTGSIVAGMADAYELTCESAYRTSAELGGYYILWIAEGNFYGDEALALTHLSNVADDPYDNVWRMAVSNFYSVIKHDPDGTQGYISLLDEVDPSTVVFGLANYVVAAYYVDAEDRKIWRQGLTDWLSRVDDSCEFPVMALGAATWALAQTGPLGETSIDPSGEGAPYWNSRKLSDLPGLLLSHQVPNGEQDAGSFYWRFDHGDAGSGESVSGYTEDAIFAALGLVAASWTDPEPNLDSAILAARAALLNGISSEGRVWERLSQEGSRRYGYGGEMLQVLRELVIPGDLDLDDRVDSIDCAIFANNWHGSGCTTCPRCDGADLDRSGDVGIVDLAILADNWLESASQ
jgi:hypothetical protein